jgi:hypothetical protein
MLYTVWSVVTLPMSNIQSINLIQFYIFMYLHHHHHLCPWLASRDTSACFLHKYLNNWVILFNHHQTRSPSRLWSVHSAAGQSNVLQNWF